MNHSTSNIPLRKLLFRYWFCFCLGLPLLLSGSFASAGNTPDNPVYPEIEGVMGVVPALENSCAAVWLAIPQGQALAGIEWFNNDGSVGFPGLYFESGVPENPVALDQTHLAASDVFGESGAWSTVQFVEAVTCASEGLYVVFQFPQGIQVSAFGEGGGPAIGYVGELTGAPGWLCSDGETWTRVGESFGFAVLPLFVEATEGMTQLDGTHGPVEVVDSTPPLVTALAQPYPNPFNPTTKIQYSLASPETIDLSIYDIRGHRVVTLASGTQAAGRYDVHWPGIDENGRSVASGLYFARFKAGRFERCHRLVLIK